ncbi:MAG: aminotransferase class III-fold pyridoxal phosphate-dependent enzyme, partial [Deltaproteobacteria bacterium]|nr:aminotransferase class III-fold pyridoxal phosphate-dependent enzyme [Deltaproteobacteria bacterium]
MSGRHADKVVPSVADALARLEDGMTIMVGGFGLSGNPEALIKGVVDRGVKNLTLVSNNAGNLGKGLAQWLRHGMIKKVICSYIGTNDDLHTRMASGEVQVEITPQGTLAERMRAACDADGALLVADEVLTGFGRTGKPFGFQHWNVTPDLITVAKGLASGYATIGAVIVSEKIAKHFDDQ